MLYKPQNLLLPTPRVRPSHPGFQVPLAQRLVSHLSSKKTLARKSGRQGAPEERSQGEKESQEWKIRLQFWRHLTIWYKCNCWKEKWRLHSNLMLGTLCFKKHA